MTFQKSSRLSNMGIRTNMIEKIVSGGQSGVDRAALDVAIALCIAHGGWCPKGRLAEDGPIAAHYQLVETISAEYNERTCLNIRDSDATLILLTSDEIRDGTLLTIDEARSKGKPYLLVNLTDAVNSHEVTAWLQISGIKILNIAGPRESNAPGVYAKSYAFLSQLFLQEKELEAPFVKIG